MRKGFLDLQVNGYLGIDFTSSALQIDDVCRVTEALTKAGTIGYCATLITAPMEVIRRNLSLLARAAGERSLRGRLLGIHLEGPYLSPEDGARGAHQVRWMRQPDPEEFDRLQECAAGNIRLLTLAPELEGAIGLISHVTKRYSTRIALGHHLAARDVIRKAIDAGATLVTHLGNGCPNLIHRHDNILVHQLAADELTIGLITDGNHLPEALIRVAFKCKRPEKIFVVSDSAPIAGLPPGLYTNMGLEVRLSETGRIEQLHQPYLAGSGCTMVHCMKYLRSLDFLADEELWQAGFETPLRILGLDPADLDSEDLPDFHW